MDGGNGQGTSVTLYELYSVGNWVSEQKNPLQSIVGSKETDGQKSYASVPQRLLRTVTARLVRTLDGLVVSPSVPPALVQLLPLVRPSWSLHPSPCGEYLAVLQEDKLEIRARSENFQVTGVAPLSPDGFPSWRQVAWSFDSQIIAVSASNGRVQIVRADGLLMCAISPKKKADGSGESLPTRPVQVDWEALGERDRNDSVGFIDPISVLFFIKPERDSKMAAFSFEAHHYTHELVTITYDGVLRSYLIHFEHLQSALPPRTTTSYIPAMYSRRSSMPGLLILRESKERAGQITFYHKFSFHHWHTCVCSAALDTRAGLLLISGKAVDQTKGKQRSGEVDARNFISEWKLVWEKPHYQMKGVEFLETSLHTSIDEEDRGGMWGNLRKVLSMDTVLLSIRPSRRKFYLDTLHHITLSPDGRRLLTLDCGGTLKLWDSARLDLVRQWTFSDLREQLNLPLPLSDPTKANANRNGMPTMSAMLISVGWWSDSSVRLSFADGYVAITEFPAIKPISGLDIAQFKCMPEVASFADDRLFVLGHEDIPMRMRLRAGVYSPLGPVPEWDDPSDSETTNSSSGKSLLYTVLSYASRPLRLFTDTILWHWEDESSPAQQTVTVMKRKYELHCLLKTTPIDALRRKIAAEDYEAAMKLADEHHLSKDEIYKAQWLRSEVTEESVSDYLSKMEDQEWVMRTCVERVPSNAKATYLLLRYGLKQTDSITRRDVEREIEDALRDSGESETELHREARLARAEGLSVASLCVFRTRLLKYLNRLETHRAIYGGVFQSDTESELGTFAEHFEWFRDSDLVSEAVELAVDENYSALEQLLTRHGKDILPYRLRILTYIPETADPTAYKQLLPKIDPSTDTEVEWQVIPWKKADWTESESVREFVKMIEDEADEQKESTTPEEFARHDYPASHADITNWYINRASEMEAASGQADTSLDLIRLGERNNVGGLEALHEDLVTLSVLLYECFDPVSKDVTDLSLDALRRRTPAEVLRLFVSQSDVNSIASDIQIFVLPYLTRLSVSSARVRGETPSAKPDPAALDLLYDWLLEIAPRQLDWCTEVFESSRASGQGERIVEGSRIAELVLKCAYRCYCTDRWDLYSRIVACLAPAKPSGLQSSKKLKKAHSWADEIAADPDFLDDADLELSNEKIDVAENVQISARQFAVHVEAARILDRYGLAKPLAWFVKADTDPIVQRQLLLLLARRSTGEDGLPPGDEFRFQNEDEWTALLEHILRLHDVGILGLVSRKDIYVEFLSVILNNGMFRLAKKILRPERSLPPLPMDVAEGLIINAANEFYDNADNGDMTQGLLKRARDCLAVLPMSPELQVEMDFIQATHQLTVRYNGVSDNTGEPILPIQIRLHGNRLHFIQQILERDSSAHRSRDALLDMTRKLLRDQYTPITKALAQALIADAALRDGDWDSAYTLCNDLILTTEQNLMQSQEVADAICSICMELGSATAIDELAKRMDMVGQALMRCPTEKMPQVLNLWTTLESEKIAKDALCHATGNAVSDILPAIGQWTESKTNTSRWQFDLDKAIDEVERQVLAFDDDSLRPDNAEDDAPLAFPAFYAQKPLLAGIDDLDEASHNLERQSPKREILETLLRLTEARAEALIDVTHNAETNGRTIDVVLGELAAEVFPTDAISAVGYLLSASQDTSAQTFFGELPSSPAIEQLACYYFSLKALKDILSADRPDALDHLHLVSPADILRNVQWLAEQYHATPEGMTTQPATDVLTTNRTQSALGLALHHAQRSQVKEEEHKLRSLYDHAAVDSAMFEKSAEYRKQVVLQMAQTTDEEALVRCYLLAEQVHVPEPEVLVSHLSWLFETDGVSLQMLRTNVKRDAARIVKYPMEVSKALEHVHTKVDGTAHGKLEDLYSLLLQHADIGEALADNLRKRIKIIQGIQKLPTLKTLDIKKMLQSRGDDVDSFLAHFGRLQSHSELESIAALIPSILSLRPVSAFKDEAELADQAQQLQAHEGVSRLYSNYAMARMPSVPWEYLEDQRIASLISQIIALLDLMMPKDLLALTMSLTVGDSAAGIPVAYREDLIAKAEAVAARLNASHSDHAQPALAEIRRIHEHLSMISMLSQISDEKAGEEIAPERLQQFDMSYGQSPQQFASIAMRMIISGTSPMIIYQACKVLSEAFVGYEAVFEPSRVYGETTLAIMGVPSDPAYEGVFRRGVDSPAAALERIIANVAEIAVWTPAATDTAAEAPQYSVPQHIASQHTTLDDDLFSGDSGWDIHGLDELDHSPKVPQDSVMELSGLSKSEESVAPSIAPWQPSSQLSQSLPNLNLAPSTTESGEGWDIGGLSPLKTMPEQASGWDIDDIDDLDLDQHHEIQPGSVGALTSEADTKIPQPAELAIENASSESVHAASTHSAAEQEGWGLDDLDELWDEGPETDPKPTGSLANKAAHAPPVVGSPSSVDTSITHSEPPSLSQTQPAASSTVVEARPIHTPSHAIPPFEIAIQSVNETLRKCLNQVVEEPDRFAPELGMQIFGILQKYFAIPEVDARKLQSSKLALIIKGAWDLEVKNDSLGTQPGRQEVLQLLLSHTRTPAQAQSLVAVLAEWLPVPEPTQMSASSIAPVPPYLQLFWMALLCWMIEHEQFEMAILVRVEFAAFEILDAKV
ncbi:secretory pathway protein Sec39-domain-containing protein [Powellomyces hirtus]|nr:secretory pathway protein Sec39-domain-containing protein [Powellomyces hirtus]